MVALGQRPRYRLTRDEMVARLTAQGVTVVAPESLTSSLYADASHPLTEGYALLAERLGRSTVFRNWVTR